MGHKHGVRDTGAHFIIDQFTRQIKNASAEKTTIVQYDHNSQRLTFEMPLYIDGHAMTLCDLIEIHYINISADGKSQNPGTYEVNDIKAEGENAIFTWLISQEATQLAGSLNFFIVFKCTENGVTVYRWGTEICKTLAISAGMDNGEEVLTEYPDILAHWKAQLFDSSNTAVSNVATAEASALAAIEAAGEAKKQSVLDSIPDEYEALSALADQNHRNKAGAIVLDAEGESIVVNDASEYPLQGLKLFGKSTQDGTPTPDSPVEIVSVENPAIRFCGANLIPYPYTNSSKTESGVTFVDNGDGSITANGTAEISIGFWFIGRNEYMAVPSGKYAIYPYGVPTGTQIDVSLYDGANWNAVAKAVDVPVTFINSEEMCVCVRWYIPGGTVLNNVTVKAMLCKDYTDLDYEPPEAHQIISVPHTLHGIPVSSGGNYTDEKGQQWICDEVDLARGVCIKRITKKILNSGVPWNEAGTQIDGTYTAFTFLDDIWTDENACYVSDKFKCYPSGDYKTSASEGIYTNLGTTNCNLVILRIDNAKATDFATLLAWLSNNPITVYCQLKEPTETPLSDSEITAFKTLHSNRPNTTILNDAGAHMAVEYVADTKTYIDRQIAALLSNET